TGYVGKLLSTTDASGFTKTFAYDIAGRTVKVSYTRVLSDGTTNVTEAQATQYDALGRGILQSVATYNSGTNTWTFGDQSHTQYTIYGAVSAKGINGVYPQPLSYDSAGRVWRSTADDGTVKLYLYDAAGNQSLVISSDGNALPTGYSWSTITLDQ